MNSARHQTPHQVLPPLLPTHKDTAYEPREPVTVELTTDMNSTRQIKNAKKKPKKTKNLQSYLDSQSIKMNSITSTLISLIA